MFYKDKVIRRFFGINSRAESYSFIVTMSSVESRDILIELGV